MDCTTVRTDTTYEELGCHYLYFVVTRREGGYAVQPYRSQVHASTWSIHRSEKHPQHVDFRALAKATTKATTKATAVVVEDLAWKRWYMKDGLAMKIHMTKVTDLAPHVSDAEPLDEHYGVEGRGTIQIGVQKQYRCGDPFDWYYVTGNFCSNTLVTFTYFVVTKRRGAADYEIRAYANPSEAETWFAPTT